MGKLVELWRSPYPTFYQRWKAVVIPSAIIFLILYILQPFGISRIKGSVFGVVAGSALIAAGASGVFYLFASGIISCLLQGAELDIG